MLLYCLIAGFGLLAASVFIRKTFIYLAMIPAWFGIMHYSMKLGESGYIQAAAAIIMIYAIVSVFISIKGGNVV